MTQSKVCFGNQGKGTQTYTHLAALTLEAMSAASTEEIALNEDILTSRRNHRDFMITLTPNNHSKKSHACLQYWVASEPPSFL